MIALFHSIVATLLAGASAQALLNYLKVPRLGRLPHTARRPLISVLIPARNEEQRIERCVRHWAAQEYPHYEVLIYDDDSSDGTATRAAAAADGRRHIRIYQGGMLPEGWRGKPHACHQLSRRARGEILVFADADVLPAPATLAATARAFQTLSADAISALPAHLSPNPLIRLLVALQRWAVLTYVPLWAERVRRHPVFATMNGQFLAIRRDAYDAAGGFASVAHALAEDVALGRLLAARGFRLHFVDGAGLLACEPYDSLRSLWTANVRNLLPIFFGSVTLSLTVAVQCYI